MDGVRIAEMDKKVLDILAELEEKKKDLVQDYKTVKKTVKENPYLKNALTVYEDYFKKQNLHVEALEHLLKVVPPADQPAIKKEIKEIKKYLI